MKKLAIVYAQGCFNRYDYITIASILESYDRVVALTLVENGWLYPTPEQIKDWQEECDQKIQEYGWGGKVITDVFRSTNDHKDPLGYTDLSDYVGKYTREYGQVDTILLKSTGGCGGFPDILVEHIRPEYSIDIIENTFGKYWYDFPYEHPEY